MNAEEFVAAIHNVVIEPMAADITSMLHRPPGRQPASELVELSTWHDGLADSDQLMIKRVIALVARNSVFGVFAVLDGARKVDSKGTANDYFELRYVHKTSEDVLSGPKGALLHELL